MRARSDREGDGRHYPYGVRDAGERNRRAQREPVRDGVAEFVADAVIALNLFGIGEGITRSLLIRKMRGTKHAKDVLPLEFSAKGLVVRECSLEKP